LLHHGVKHKSLKMLHVDMISVPQFTPKSITTVGSGHQQPFFKK